MNPISLYISHLSGLFINIIRQAFHTVAQTRHFIKHLLHDFTKHLLHDFTISSTILQNISSTILQFPPLCYM